MRVGIRSQSGFSQKWFLLCPRTPCPICSQSQQSKSGEEPFLVQVWALPTLSSSLGPLVKATSTLSLWGKSTSTSRVEALAPGDLKYHLPSEQRPHITPAPLELCVLRKEPHTGDQGSNLIHQVLLGGAFFPSSSSGKHHPTTKGFCRDQGL